MVWVEAGGDVGAGFGLLPPVWNAIFNTINSLTSLDYCCRHAVKQLSTTLHTMCKKRMATTGAHTFTHYRHVQIENAIQYAYNMELKKVKQTLFVFLNRWMVVSWV